MPISDLSVVLGNILSDAKTEAQWTNDIRILPYGYIAVSFDALGNKKIKIGDGTKTWSELDFFERGGGDGKLKAIVDSGAGLKIVLTDAAAENPTLQEYQYSYSIRTFAQTITTTATDGGTTTATTQTVNNQSVEKLYDNRGALLLTAHYSDTTIGTIDYYTDKNGMKIWLGEGYLDE